MKVREFIDSCVNDKKRKSLDEVIGTIMTLTSAILAMSGIIAPQFQEIFLLATVVMTVFFWVAYRIAKTLHSIEFRLMIVASFFTTLFWLMIFPSITALELHNPLYDFIITNALFYAGYTVMILLFIRVADRIWFWLSQEELGDWSPLGVDMMFVEDKSGESGALIHLSIIGYGLVTTLLLIAGTVWFIGGIILVLPIVIAILLFIRHTMKNIYELWFVSLTSLNPTKADQSQTE